MPVKRSYIVIGRYLFSYSPLAIMILLSLASLSAVSLFSGDGFDFTYVTATLIGSSLVTTLLISFQLPIYFKQGYTKGRSTAMFPLPAVCAVIFLGLTLFADSDIIRRLFSSLNMVNPMILAAFAVLICITINCLSFLLSRKFYEKRDF